MFIQIKHLLYFMYFDTATNKTAKFPVLVMLILPVARVDYRQVSR